MKTVALDKCKAETSTIRTGSDVYKFWKKNPFQFVLMFFSVLYAK